MVSNGMGHWHVSWNIFDQIMTRHITAFLQRGVSFFRIMSGPMKPIPDLWNLSNHSSWTIVKLDDSNGDVTVPHGNPLLRWSAPQHGARIPRWPVASIWSRRDQRKPTTSRRKRRKTRTLGAAVGLLVGSLGVLKGGVTGGWRVLKGLGLKEEECENGIEIIFWHRHVWMIQNHTSKNTDMQADL